MHFNVICRSRKIMKSNRSTHLTYFNPTNQTCPSQCEMGSVERRPASHNFQPRGAGRRRRSAHKLQLDPNRAGDGAELWGISLLHSAMRVKSGRVCQE